MADTTTKIKYFIYARKSSESEDRQVLSIGSQVDALKELKDKSNLSIIETLTESKTAKMPGRPIFNEMLQRIRQGEAQGILCWKLDRLARNPVDGGEIAWLLQQGTIKHILTPEREYHPEDNVMLMNVEFGMANQFILDLRKNTMRGLTTKAKQGWYPGFAKPGYLNEKYNKKGEKQILKDPDRYHIIKKAFELMLTGVYSPMQILDKLNNGYGYRTLIKGRMGGKPMVRSAIYEIFSDPFYYGKFEYPQGSGNWYDGKHEPMITSDEYFRIQELLGRPGRPRPKIHTFAYTGLLRCAECGAAITAEEKTKTNKGNGLVHHYTYYRCTRHKNPNCTQQSVEVKVLEKQIDEYLQRIEIPEDFKNWVLRWLGGMNEKEIKSRAAIAQTQQKTYNDTQRQLDNLTQMKIKELVTDGEYVEQKNRLLKTREQLSAQLKSTEQRADNWMEQVEKTFTFSCYARRWFKNGSMEQKKAILSTLGSHLLIKDRKITMDLRQHFQIIEKGLNNIREESVSLEPLKIISINEKREASASQISSWGARADSNCP